MTTIFTYVALGYIALAAIDRFYNNRVSVKDTLYMLFLIAVSVAVFVFSKDMAVSIVNNSVADFIVSNQASQEVKLLVYCLLIVASTGITWHGLLKYIVKPRSRSGRFFLGVASTMIGLVYLSSALHDIAQKKWAIASNDQLMFFGIAAALVFLAILLWHYHKEIQEIVAIPLGGIILYGSYIYAYYQATGINIMENASSAGHAAGGTIITLVLAFLYGIVWYRQKAWYERRSYKILAIFAMIMMILSTGASVLYLIGAIDRQEWQATRFVNIAHQKINERQAKQITKAIIDGYSQDQAMAVIDNPSSSDKEVERAMHSLETRRKLQAERVAASKGPKSTINLEKAEKVSSPIVAFFKKGLKTTSSWLHSIFFSSHKTTRKSVVKTYTFTGIGFTGGDDGKGGVTILTNGKNVHYGDRVTILGEHAQGWIAMKYKPTINGKVSFINRARINGDIGARAPKGEQFTVIVQKN